MHKEIGVAIAIALALFVIESLTACTASLSWYPVDHIDHNQTWDDSAKRRKH